MLEAALLCVMMLGLAMVSMPMACSAASWTCSRSKGSGPSKANLA